MRVGVCAYGQKEREYGYHCRRVVGWQVSANNNNGLRNEVFTCPSCQGRFVPQVPVEKSLRSCCPMALKRRLDFGPNPSSRSILFTPAWPFLNDLLQPLVNESFWKRSQGRINLGERGEIPSPTLKMLLENQSKVFLVGFGVGTSRCGSFETFHFH